MNYPVPNAVPFPFRPLGPRVVVERDKSPGRVGAIYVPDSAKKEVCQGVVLAVGPGLLLESGERVPPGVRVGERVIWGERGGGYNTVKVEGREVLSMHQDEILAVIEP